MLDRELVLVKLAEHERYVRDLEAVAPRDRAAFDRDLGARLACERALHIGIESLLDVAELFVKGLRLGLPSGEAGIVQRLADHGVLAPEEAKLLRDMQGFRNVLVHRYGKLDHDRVYAAVRNGPRDMRRVAKALRDAMEQVRGK